MAASAIAIGIVSNPSAAWAVLNTIQLISLMPLNYNPLTTGIKEFCSSLGGYSFISNPMPYIFSRDIYDPAYEEAKEYGITTSCFWINIGPTIAVFVGMLILWLIVWILTKINFGKIILKLIKNLGNYRYSVFLRFLAQAYLNTGLFSFIQVKSVIFI